MCVTLLRHTSLFSGFFSFLSHATHFFRLTNRLSLPWLPAALSESPAIRLPIRLQSYDSNCLCSLLPTWHLARGTAQHFSFFSFVSLLSSFVLRCRASYICQVLTGGALRARQVKCRVLLQVKVIKPQPLCSLLPKWHPSRVVSWQHEKIRATLNQNVYFELEHNEAKQFELCGERWLLVKRKFLLLPVDLSVYREIFFQVS